LEDIVTTNKTSKQNKAIRKCQEFVLRTSQYSTSKFVHATKSEEDRLQNTLNTYLKSIASDATSVLQWHMKTSRYRWDESYIEEVVAIWQIKVISRCKTNLLLKNSNSKVLTEIYVHDD